MERTISSTTSFCMKVKYRVSIDSRTMFRRDSDIQILLQEVPSKQHIAEVRGAALRLWQDTTRILPFVYFRFYWSTWCSDEFAILRHCFMLFSTLSCSTVPRRHWDWRWSRYQLQFSNRIQFTLLPFSAILPPCSLFLSSTIEKSFVNSSLLIPYIYVGESRYICSFDMLY